jgi:hypothetical protein
MALFTVSIAGVSPDPEVYGGLVAATAYIGARIGDAYTAWRALDEDDKERTLVSATSYVDSFTWVGTANAFDSTTLEWPRDDVTDSSGATLTNAEQLAIIERAVFELAALAADDPDVFALLDGSGNIASVGAGGASVSYFNPTSTSDGSAPKFPNALIDRLLARFLAATTTNAYATITAGQAGDSDSGFSRCEDYDRSEPW